MAEVKLQVIVKREQVDALQKDIDKLNKTKIIINTQESNKNIQQTQKTLQQLEKTQQQQLKTEQERQKLTQQQARTEQEALRVEKERASIIGQKAKNEKEIARAEQENAKAIKEVHRAEQAAIKTERERAKATEQSAKATEQHGKATREAAKQESFMEKILGRTTGEFIARMTIYRGVYAGIRAVTNGFREAIQTLRAVDDELVTVRKVTGFDQYQMAGVENQAYAVASKYGASASDYVSSVASFARAGYKDLSGDLAELAEKTKIVGDTTAEIANQFLLSMDAAYKYQGSVSKLNRILDVSNEIDNKWATSIEKLAEGMGIVAPVAAQLHVTEDELVAMLGTITAVTQRSGSEAARALRSILINLTSDVNAVFEETNGEITYAIGEIDGLRDIVMEYAGDLYKAAEAQGKIVNPAEVIEAMVKAAEQGRLTEQKLYSIVTDESGKLRAAQMWALIQNWNTMYKSMLNDAANAAGSADKEIANAMDSWTRKTNVLKNTWTEFIKSGLNSGQIKFLLDALTWIIKHLGTLNGAVIRLGTALAALKLFSTARELTQISKGLLDVKNGASKAARMFTEMGVSAKALNVASGIIGGLTLAWTAYTAIQAEIERKHQERVQAIYNEAEAAKESAGNVLDLYVEMDKAADSASDFTSQAKTLADTLGIDLAEGADKARQKIAELSAEELRRSADKANTALITAQDEYMAQYGGEYYGKAKSLTYARGQLSGLPDDLSQKINEIYSSLPTVTKMFSDGSYSYQNSGGSFSAEFFDLDSIENAIRFRDALEEIIDARDEYIRQTGDSSVLDSEYFSTVEEYLGETSEAFSALEKARKDAIDTQAMELFQKAVTSSTVQSKEDLDELISRFRGARNVSEEVREKLVELANKYYDFSDAAEKATDSTERQTVALNENEKALDKNATSEERAAAAKKDAENAARKFIGALINENGELTANGIEALKASSYLADLVNAEIAAQQEAQRANYANMRAQLAALAADAVKAAKAIMVAYAASESLVSLKRYAIENGATPDVMKAITLLKSMEGLESRINATSVTATAVAPYTTGYKPSSGSGSSGSSGHSGGSSGSGSSGGGKSSSSSASTEDKKLTALQNRVNLLKSELSLMQERGDSEEAQAAKMREIMAALKNEADYLKSIKGDQITINNLSQEWWSYNNKLSELMDKEAKSAQDQAEALQKALEAQKALNNALKDRSVRYYNAQTGQWEWTANAENVANATKARDEAISAAGYDNLDAWNTYYKIASTMESIRAFADFVNAHPSVSIWDIPGLMQNSYTSNYGGTSNSTVYNFGGFNLSEQQAKGTSVYELARRSRNLALHNSTY